MLLLSPQEPFNNLLASTVKILGLILKTVVNFQIQEFYHFAKVLSFSFEINDRSFAEAYM